MRDTTHDRRLDGRLRSAEEHALAVARCPICTPLQPVRGEARERLLDRLEIKLAFLDAVDQMRAGNLVQLPATEDVDRLVNELAGRMEPLRGRRRRAARTTTIVTRTGETKTFEAAGGRVQISPFASVVLI